MVFLSYIVVGRPISSLHNLYFHVHILLLYIPINLPWMLLLHVMTLLSTLLLSLKILPVTLLLHRSLIHTFFHTYMDIHTMLLYMDRMVLLLHMMLYMVLLLYFLPYLVLLLHILFLLHMVHISLGPCVANALDGSH